MLEFDFVPESSTVQFQYVFSSDEYNECVGLAVQRHVRLLRQRRELRSLPGSNAAGGDQHDQRGNPSEPEA